MGKRDIYIIGGSGFAKEVYFILKQVDQFNIKGFIDYKATSKSITFHNEDIEVFEEDVFLSKIKDANLCLGTGKPENIIKIKEKFSRYNFPNIVHPSFIGDLKNINIGKGNIITPGVLFTTHITVGSFNIFNLNVTVGHDCMIGNFNVFNPSVNISGNCKIGDGNLFGVSSVVLEKKNIGNNNVLGASSLLLKDIEDNGVYVGAPAKYLKSK